ncbi:MAG: OmpA family protein [Acinetobacter sp.]
MNIIELLKEKVTSKILQGDNQFQDEKIGALAAFYPILLTVLKSKPELIRTLQQSLNPRLGDVFNNNSESVSDFLGLVGGDAPPNEIEKTLNHAISPTLYLLEDQAGTDDKSVIFDLIQSQWSNIQAALPAWASGLFSAIGLSIAGLGFGAQTQAAPAVETIIPTPPVDPIVTAPAPPEPPSNHQAASEPEPKKSNLFLTALIALLILILLAFLLLRSCKNDDVTAPANQATADAQQPAHFQITTDPQGGLVTCSAKIGHEQFTTALQNEVKQIFSHTVGCGIDSSQTFNAELIDQNALVSVLKLVKGIPNASLTWTGNEISLQGADQATLQALAEKIKPLVKDMNVVVQQPLSENEAVSSSIDQAKQALQGIDPSKARALDIATALNMQIINFASGSNSIPDVNKPILDQAAALMNHLPKVQLLIKGYTDSVGNADANKVLSQKRAQAVADYLMSKGVSPDKLLAQGFGQENPIADNGTKEGQFKNRRIEFEVTNTETGITREVSEEGIEKKQ